MKLMRKKRQVLKIMETDVNPQLSEEQIAVQLNNHVNELQSQLSRQHIEHPHHWNIIKNLYLKPEKKMLNVRNRSTSLSSNALATVLRNKFPRILLNLLKIQLSLQEKCAKLSTFFNSHLNGLIIEDVYKNATINSNKISTQICFKFRFCKASKNRSQLMMSYHYSKKLFSIRCKCTQLNQLKADSSPTCGSGIILPNNKQTNSSSTEVRRKVNKFKEFQSQVVTPLKSKQYLNNNSRQNTANNQDLHGNHYGSHCKLIKHYTYRIYHRIIKKNANEMKRNSAECKVPVTENMEGKGNALTDLEPCSVTNLNIESNSEFGKQKAKSFVRYWEHNESVNEKSFCRLNNSWQGNKYNRW
ncbi:hypothetical protein CVS40_11237 [Lucilia cuprina]|nr:hypothetical protein CVS40_11237 [Lucilia cuprina]